jgi:hypothetical protein
MSTIIMSMCWPLQMPPSPKAVLVSLADNANDHGECWPSIPTICDRTCLGRTAVIDAIKWLEQAGYLGADRTNGRHTRYTVLVRNQELFQVAKPVRQADRSGCQTGTPSGLYPSGKRTGPVRQADSNRQEPSITVNKKSNARVRGQPAERSDGDGDLPTPKPEPKAKPIEQPAEVTDATWRDWLALRKRKRAEVTATVVAAAKAEAEKAGMTLEAFFVEWCLRGSQGLKAAWIRDGPMAGAAAGSANHGRQESAIGKTMRIIREIHDSGGIDRRSHGASVGEDDDPLRAPLDEPVRAGPRAGAAGDGGVA